MDDDYYRYQAGHPRHGAAYEKEFYADGIDPTGDSETRLSSGSRTRPLR